VVDLFEEVEEQIRSDRYRDLALKAVPWLTAILAAVLVGYLGYWGFKIYQDHRLEAATLQYQNGVDALSAGDKAAAQTDFAGAAKQGDPAYEALGLMQQGGLAVSAGKPDQAAKLFDAAAKATRIPVFSDLAQLRAAFALLDHTPLPQMRTRLEPLTDQKRPYWAYARQALAMAELMAGQTAKARADLQTLSLRLDAPQDVRQEAAMAVQSIDGGAAASAIAAAKAAPLAPPPLPPPSSGQGQESQGAEGGAQ